MLDLARREVVHIFQNWLNELRKDKHLLKEAAIKAQKGLDYILMEPPFKKRGANRILVLTHFYFFFH